MDWKRYTKSATWVFFEKILRIFFGFFVGIWIVRYLGAENYGKLSLAQSFVGLFVIISKLGLESIVVKKLVNKEEKEEYILGTALSMRLLGFVAMIATIFTFSLNYEEDIRYLIYILSFSNLFTTLSVLDLYFQSKVDNKLVALSNIFALIASSIVKIILISFDASLYLFALAILFDSFVSSTFFVYFFYKKGGDIMKWRFDINLSMSLLKESWPLIISGALITVYMKVDQLMLQHMTDIHTVGIYAVAVNLSERIYFIPMVICSTLFPAIIKAKENSLVDYKVMLQKLYDLMFVLAIILVIPLSYFGHSIISLLYGESFSASSSVFVIHVFSGFFVFLGVASSKWFVAEGLQIYSLYRALSGVVVNIVLNYFLIPEYGANGAAISTLFSQAFASYIFNAFSGKTVNTFLMQTKTIFFFMRIKRREFER